MDSAAPEIEDELGIMDIAGEGLSGTVVLVRTSGGLAADLVIDGLTPGNAYSVWWAIFNNPQGCDGPCDPADIFNTNQAQTSLVNGGGFVGTAGTILHDASLARHDPAGRQVYTGDPKGIRNPYGAEVHVVIRNHGPAETDPANLQRQLTTFGEFCRMPVVGCRNVGAAPFKARVPRPQDTIG